MGDTDLHHLYFDKHKGWVMRLTVEIHRKKVGKRVKIPCRTRDPEKAKWLRDSYLRTFVNVLGLRIVGHNGKDVYEPPKGKGVA